MSAIPSTPKRKRAQSPVYGNVTSSASGIVFEEGSPRARIVTTFRDLQLRSVGDFGTPLDEGEDDVPNDLGSLTASRSPRKRPKLEDKVGLDAKADTGVESRDDAVEGAPATIAASAHISNRVTKDISDSDKETSDNKCKPQMLPGAISITDFAILDKGSPPRSKAISALAARQKKSPPPQSHHESTSSLVWHESEITGHLMDDPDDDGVGINGLGFKPSSTIAYARAQKRKQQIAEWRARESREARQKRGERRWRVSADARENKSVEHRAASGRVGKAVRFAA